MAKLRKILINPDPKLRLKSKKIDSKYIKNPEFIDFCSDLVLTMQKKDGVGLAAPQIDKRIRVIAVNADKGPMIFINPVITKRSWAKNLSEEGCLSVPNTFGQVSRHNKIKCNYIDRNGNAKTMATQGLMARILQHEIDHLDGILFIDKAKKIIKS